MNESTIDHSCSYHCDRPECIKAQRDEMRERLKQIEAQEPVGIVGAGPRAGGFTMATFEAEKVPVGTNLYTKPEANEQPKDSQPVPVEPDAIVRWRFIKEKTGGLEPRLVYVLDYIDTLQSELKRVTEERDKEKEIMTPAENLAYELDGVISDVEKGGCFDGVCLLTIKRVRDALAAGETAPPSDFAAGVSRIPRADGAARNLRQDR